MLTLYLPEYKDLWFRRQMLEDEKTMSYNHAWGGTIPFPEEKWRDWYDHWIAEPENRRFYRYLRSDEDGFVGETAFHYDSELDGYIADVIIYSAFRNRGYGGEGLDLLCAAARESGIDVLYDDIAADNPAISIFLRHGFTEEYRTEDKIILKKDLLHEQIGIRLERFTEDDRSLLEELVFNESTMKMNLGRVFTQEEADLFFRAVRSVNVSGGKAGYYKVFACPEGKEEYIGMGALSFNEVYSAAEIEYMLLPQYWNKGYGTQLVKILTEMSENSGLSAFTVAICDPENTRSRKVLQKNGFVSARRFINDDSEPAELFVKPVDPAAAGSMISSDIN